MVNIINPYKANIYVQDLYKNGSLPTGVEPLNMLCSQISAAQTLGSGDNKFNG